MSEKIFEKFPVLDLGDIVLRELSPTDAKPFLDYLQDPKVNKYIAVEDIPRTMEQSVEEIAYWADLFKYRRSIYWAIARKDNDKIIGTCGFNVWSRTHKRVEISYDLSRSYWNKGIMTRCIRAICDYAFSVMQANRVQATVAHDNIASRRVLEKLGFKMEGDLREYGYLHGKMYDFYMMSLLASDMEF